MARGNKATRSPGCAKRPNFRPPYQSIISKPRVFQRPPYAQQLMPTSQENAQVIFSTTKVWPCYGQKQWFHADQRSRPVCHGSRQCPHELFKFLHYLNVGTICVTVQHSKQTFKGIQASWLLEPIQANPL
ncbi:hypothetical protein TNCV_1719971 [Trichonephila clavipes]|nr:hypothetical protein TNCV_1719971 [Trichonephila clavipes]